MIEDSWHKLLEYVAAGRAADKAAGRGANAGDSPPLWVAPGQTIASIMDPLHGNCYNRIAAASLAGPLVIAQIGQSLDGRIATESGDSHYINCPESLDHLHRLRALCDAVIIGASTADMDDPQLTTRRVEGPDPVRVVVDPSGRVPGARKVLSDGMAPSLLITGPGTPEAEAEDYTRVELVLENGGISPPALLAALRDRGLGTILIEGGANTVSRFLAAGVVDYLHVLVAPLILGSGRAGLQLPVIQRVTEGFRPQTRTYQLGADILFDCDLRSSA